ncbi:MAG: hypothetical protein R3Y22_04765 [Bacteroidales bacterium]
MRKNLSKLLTLTSVLLFSLGSCDENYDLNKEINTDVSILPNLTLPIGNSDAITLDQIIETSEDLTINNDGIYEISALGNISSEIEAISTVTVSGMSPDINDVVIEVRPYSGYIPTATTDYNIDTQETDFSVSAIYDITEELPKEVETFNSAKLMYGTVNAVPVTIHLNIPEIPQGVDKLILKNVTVELPKIFVAQDANSENKIIFDNIEVDATDIAHSIVFYITDIVIPEGEEDKYIKTNNDGTKSLVISESLSLSSDVLIYINPTQITTTSVTLELDSSSQDATVNDIQGSFVTDDIIETEVSLGDLPDFITDDSNSITPSDISIYLNFNNPMNVTINTDISITAIDNSNNPISSPVVIPITLEPYENDILISNTTKNEPGYTNIINEQLTNLFNKIPSKFIISSSDLKATTANESQSIQLGESYHIEGDFMAKLPFIFENIQLFYSDRINNLQEDLADYTDIVDKLIASAKVTNTIPAELELTAKCYDYANNELPGLTIDLAQFIVSAAQSNGVATTSDIKFTISQVAGSDDLERLETIEYTVNAASIENGVELKPTQYIQFSEITIAVPNGLTLEL